MYEEYVMKYGIEGAVNVETWDIVFLWVVAKLLLLLTLRFIQIWYKKNNKTLNIHFEENETKKVKIN